MGTTRAILPWIFILLLASSPNLIFSRQNPMLTQSPSTLVFAYNISGFSWFSHFTATGSYDYHSISAVHAGLFTRSSEPNNPWIPDLAAKPITESDITYLEDGRVRVIVELKAGLKFASGADITTEDVIFSYKLALTSKINKVDYFFYSYVLTKDSILDVDGAIQFEFTKHFAFIEELLSLPIVEKAEYDGLYEGCLTDSWTCDWSASAGFGYDRFMQGAGPYKLVSFLEEAPQYNNHQAVILEKNPYYWDSENVKVDNLVFVNIVSDLYSQDMVVQELINNQIDVAGIGYNFKRNEFDNRPQIVDQVINDFSLSEMPINHNHPIIGTGIETPLGISNSSMATYGAKYARQAIAQIMDRNYYKNVILEGYGEPAATTVPVVSNGYDSTIRPYQFNISAAKESMEHAGYNYSSLEDIDEDGKYDSYFFDLTLITPANFAHRVLFANSFVDNFYEIGINITRIIDNSGDWWTRSVDQPQQPDIYSRGGFDMIFLTWFWNKDWIPLNRYRSNEIRPFGLNFYNYQNSTFDKMLDDYLAEADFFERNTILESIQHHLKDELITIPIVNYINHGAKNCKVQGIESILAGSTHFQWKNFEVNEKFCPGWTNSTISPITNEDGDGPNFLFIGGAAMTSALLIFVVLRQYYKRREERKVRSIIDKKGAAKEYLDRAKRLADDVNEE